MTADDRPRPTAGDVLIAIIVVLFIAMLVIVPMLFILSLLIVLLVLLWLRGPGAATS